MKYIFCLILNLIVCLSVVGQFDTIIKSLVEIPPNHPQRLDGFLKKKTESRAGAKIEYYRLVKSKIEFCYYPKQPKLSCGYFKLYGRVFSMDKKLEDNLGCDLDYGSFELYTYHLNGRDYIIVNAIRYGSGTTARFIYCNLFDITDKHNIGFHALTSMYGSGLSFGDYNNDNKIDFLEIGYQKKAQTTDKFTLIMKSYDERLGAFRVVENKYINFTRHYSIDDSFEITKSDFKW